MATRRKRRKADGGMVAKTLQYLATQEGFFAERRNSGALKVGDRFITLGSGGVLDISGFFTPIGGGYAVYFEIEAKSSTGKLRASQAKRIAMLIKARVPFCVARTLDDVKRFTVQMRSVCCVAVGT